MNTLKHNELCSVLLNRSMSIYTVAMHAYVSPRYKGKQGDKEATEADKDLMNDIIEELEHGEQTERTPSINQLNEEIYPDQT